MIGCRVSAGGQTLCDDFNQQNAELCANLLQRCSPDFEPPLPSKQSESDLQRHLTMDAGESCPFQLSIVKCSVIEAGVAPQHDLEGKVRLFLLVDVLLSNTFQR